MIRRKECKPNLVANTYIRPSMAMYAANIRSTLATVGLATVPVYGYERTDYDRPPYNEEVSPVRVRVPAVSVSVSVSVSISVSVPYTYRTYTGT
jgi:hypothetical protein